MNATNPFQIPTCFETTLTQRRQDRLKKTVFAIVATGVLLMLGLLIEGCVSTHSARMQSGTSLSDATPAAVETQPAVAAKAEPASVSLPAPAVVTQSPQQPVQKVSAPAAAGQLATVYVVKSGDTLARIAKTHGTTVKAIKAANGLDTDHITVGQKLKLGDA
jgi:LysM repeat protein